MRKLFAVIVALGLLVLGSLAGAQTLGQLQESALHASCMQLQIGRCIGTSVEADSSTFSVIAGQVDTTLTYDIRAIWPWEGGLSTEVKQFRIYASATYSSAANCDSARIYVDASADGSNWKSAYTQDTGAQTLGGFVTAGAGVNLYKTPPPMYSYLASIPWGAPYIRLRIDGIGSGKVSGVRTWICYRGYVVKK